MKKKSIKKIALNILIILFFASFKKNETSDYLVNDDADLVMADVKVKIIGVSEYSFTEAVGNFYDNTSNAKIYNRDVYINDVSTMFSLADTTYKIVDTSFVNTNSNNFIWSFTDLTDTNNIIQYTTTKPITRVSQFDLSTINSVSKTAGFIFSHPLVTADSIMYVIGADSLTSVKKTVVNQSYGVNFTPQELSQLSMTETGAFIMLVFNTMPQTYNGKKYSFQNNSTIMVMPLPIN